MRTQQPKTAERRVGVIRHPDMVAGEGRDVISVVYRLGSAPLEGYSEISPKTINYAANMVAKEFMEFEPPLRVIPSNLSVRTMGSDAILFTYTNVGIPFDSVPSSYQIGCYPGCNLQGEVSG